MHDSAYAAQRHQSEQTATPRAIESMTLSELLYRVLMVQACHPGLPSSSVAPSRN